VTFFGVLARNWLVKAVEGLPGRSFLERQQAGGGLGTPVLRIWFENASLPSAALLFPLKRLHPGGNTGLTSPKPRVKITPVREKISAEGVLFPAQIRAARFFAEIRMKSLDR
jgi:hypothetical protein